MISKKQLDEIAATVGGVPVWGCLPGSTAAEAGVRYGDIVLAVNGVRTTNIEAYLEARKLRSDGFELKLFRAGVEIELFVAFRPPKDPIEALAQIVEGRFVSPSDPTELAPAKSLPS